LSGIPAEEEVKLIIWPKKVSFWQSLFGKMGAKTDLIAHRNLEKTISLFKLLERNNVWALMPLGIEPE
jgi:formylmethanofuran dehydrogenase subunit B